MCNNLQHKLGNQEIFKQIDNLHLNFGLYLISQVLNSNGKTLTKFGLPKAKYDWLLHQYRLITAELEYDMAVK